jgi:hypothetical protein
MLLPIVRKQDLSFYLKEATSLDKFWVSIKKFNNQQYEKKQVYKLGIFYTLVYFDAKQLYRNCNSTE